LGPLGATRCPPSGRRSTAIRRRARPIYEPYLGPPRCLQYIRRSATPVWLAVAKRACVVPGGRATGLRRTVGGSMAARARSLARSPGGCSVPLCHAGEILHTRMQHVCRRLSCFACAPGIETGLPVHVSVFRCGLSACWIMMTLFSISHPAFLCAQ